ncbi:MAG: pyruvate kinase alpha/beta domain-containing protein [Candidatus Bathyarchaeia archaeon]|jgi:hypothetical protein
MSERKSIIYFSKPGEGDADETMKAAYERAKELGIRDIVVASTRGATALKALEVFKGYNVVVVPHVWGSREAGSQELPEETAEKIRSMGGRIVYAAHAFSGVNRAIQAKFDTMYPAGVIAQTLRLFGQGMKVVVEISAMAADAGTVPVDRDVIAIAGSGKGADTAVVIKPAYSHSIFEAVVREIIAKPREI